jgi:hypothetical protein
MDFALTKQVSGLRLVSRIAEQADLRQWWEGESHLVLRKPNPAALGPVVRTLRDDDILRERGFESSMSRSRQGVPDIINKIEAAYRFSGRTAAATAVVVVEDAGSQSKFGVRILSVDLDLIRDPTTAALVVARELARRQDPRWLVSWEMPTTALEFRRGDLVGIDHLQASYAKAEILSLPVAITDTIVLRIEAIVWEE